ncbi:PREDICTED: acyl-coenzyme A thioesterase THEM4-like [Gekko japonicus]|uniref:Acyl-coenzyme A thioesterase THEM4 n=1 Tax=Gekko japonicus TaxID=146911 RepID=A0ABM1LH52_GEKJA|nr:PREDICTED: acyl-coenzyme A thioesterase THEM4-like [Gekko japonicus]
MGIATEASAMHALVRSSGRLAKGLGRLVVSRHVPQLAESRGALQCPTHRLFLNSTASSTQSGSLMDYSLPNSSWSEDMMEEFKKFMGMCEDRTWRRIPSHRYLEKNISVWRGKVPQEEEEGGEKKRETRFFCRNIDGEGLGFEYVMFFNQSEKRVVCIFQPGDYLESYAGMVHGGCIATILDNAFTACVVAVAGRGFVVNLNVNYKSPIRLGSVVLVDSKIEKMEGRKMFLSGQVRSKDGQTLHADATALLILSDSKKSSRL